VNDDGSVDLGGSRYEQIGNSWTAVLSESNQLALNLACPVGHHTTDRKLLVERRTVGGDRIEVGEIPSAVPDLQVDHRRRREYARVVEALQRSLDGWLDRHPGERALVK
jgi:hypothetical protein